MVSELGQSPSSSPAAAAAGCGGGLLLLGEVVEALLRVLDQVLHGAVQGQRAANLVQPNDEVCARE